MIPYLLGTCHRVELRLPALLPKGSFAQLSDASSAIASGLGFGLTHSLVMYGAILSQGGGVESVSLSGCDDLSLFNISGKYGIQSLQKAISSVTFWANLPTAAGNALLVNVLHMGLMIWAFDAYRKVGWKSYIRWGLMVTSHLAFSLLVSVYDYIFVSSMYILEIMSYAVCYFSLWDTVRVPVC